MIPDAYREDCRAARWGVVRAMCICAAVWGVTIAAVLLACMGGCGR